MLQAAEEAAEKSETGGDNSVLSLKTVSRGVESTVASRRSRLRDVFVMMDVDKTKYIEAAELMMLGQARRQLGHPSGTWTEQKNARLVCRMDTSGDGKIEVAEFVEHFDNVLPQEESEFGRVMAQFQEVARVCREKCSPKAPATTLAPPCRSPGGSPSFAMRQKEWMAKQDADDRAWRAARKKTKQDAKQGSRVSSPAASVESSVDAAAAETRRTLSIMEKRFDEIDLNGDGVIDRDEFLRACTDNTVGYASPRLSAAVAANTSQVDLCHR